MLRCMFIDFKRAFLNHRFFLAVLFCAAIYLLGSVSERGATFVPYILDASMNYGAFDFLFPLVPVLPFASSLIEDRNSGFLKFVFQRVSIRQYLTSRFLTAALAGALANILGMLLFLLGISVFFPYAGFSGEASSVQYLYMKNVIANRQWFLYFAFFSLLQGLSGIFWASAAFTVSTFVKSAQLLYLTVVLLNEALSRVMFALGQAHLSSLAAGAVEAGSMGAVLALASGVFLGLSLMCFLACQLIGGRKLQYV